jgi:hypothetical protein
LDPLDFFLSIGLLALSLHLVRHQSRKSDCWSAKISEAGLLLYVELAGMFPNRSGAEVVYLEQAYPRPRFFVPTVFAISAVLLSCVPV